MDADTGQVWTRFDWVGRRSVPRVSRSRWRARTTRRRCRPSDGRTLVVNPGQRTGVALRLARHQRRRGRRVHHDAGNNVAGLHGHRRQQLAGRRLQPERRRGAQLRLPAQPGAGAEHVSPGRGDQPVLLEQHHPRRAVPVRLRRSGRQLPGQQLRPRRRWATTPCAPRRRTAPAPTTRTSARRPTAQRPRMQMFVWTSPNPDRDGDLDAGIVVHEYGHGISNRLVGGPANVNCLTNRQQPGEGLSDWWALAYTAEAGDTGADAARHGHVRARPADQRRWAFARSVTAPIPRSTPGPTPASTAWPCRTASARCGRRRRGRCTGSSSTLRASIRTSTTPPATPATSA